MVNTISRLTHDENGFIVSAELVLIATILVIGMIVGLVEIQCSVVQELNDVGDAIGCLNQGYQTVGLLARKRFGGSGNNIKAQTFGSAFVDVLDDCDKDQCQIVCQVGNGVEAPKGVGGGAGGVGGFGFRR